jgi:hypothetical protein
MASMTDPYLLGPGLLPTPFTADEIRAGCPDGRTIRLFVEPAEGEPFERVNRFVEGDESGATLERWWVGPDGLVDGEVERERTSWVDLQRHAAFPAERTTRSRETIELPIGHVECLRYDVRPEASVDAAELAPGVVPRGATAGWPVATFWFSPAHPGMPVRYEQPGVGGAVDRTTMVSDEVEVA